VLGALIAFVRQQWFLYVILFTLALITRETSLLLLPGLVLFLPTISEKVVDSSTSNRILLYFKILMPLLFYGLYLLLFMNTYGQFGATKLEIESRYSCFLENFESTRNTVESILSLFFALGPFVYLLVFQKIAYNTKVLKNNWVRAFVLSLILNTPLVILTAFARESRLFALPLLLIWPLFAQLFRKEINLIFSIDAYRQLFRNRKYTLILLIFNLLNFVGCFYYYLKLGLGENNLYAEYLFLINFMIISHFLKYMAKKDLSSRPTLNG
jgi:hypothetical protein